MVHRHHHPQPFQRRNSCWDLEVKSIALKDDIADLYTHTEVRDWGVGDQVDVLASAQYDLWLQGTVVDRDFGKDKVTVELSQEKINRGSEKYGVPTTDLPSIPTTLRDIDMCSDFVAPLGTFTGLHNMRSDGISSRGVRVVPLPALSGPDSVTVQRSKNIKRRRDDEEEEEEVARNKKSSSASTSTSSTVRAGANTTWLAPLLRARQVSKEHIQLCEEALVRDEGFTTAEVFGEADRVDLNICFNRHKIFTCLACRELARKSKK